MCCFDAKWKRITDALAFYIAKGMAPIHTAEKSGFQHFLSYVILPKKSKSKIQFSEKKKNLDFFFCAKSPKTLIQTIPFYTIQTSKRGANQPGDICCWGLRDWAWPGQRRRFSLYPTVTGRWDSVDWERRDTETMSVFMLTESTLIESGVIVLREKLFSFHIQKWFHAVRDILTAQPASWVRQSPGF